MEPTAFLATRHDPLFVAASLLVATFASYVTLDLARRVARGGRARRLWWLGGSLAMGTGIWAMHFVGMLGFETGLPLGYRWQPTLLSWIAAVAAAAVALGIAARSRLTPALLLCGSASMAAGICTMHYLGMHAVELEPGIVWRPAMVVASIVIAWTASAVALGLFFVLRTQRGTRRLKLQVASALVMGGAIGGMHYTGMGAAQLPLDSVCLSADGLAGPPLAALVTIATLVILAGALLLSAIDAMAQARESKLTTSLHQANQDLRVANDALQRKAFEDPLTGLPNRALFDDRLGHAVSRVARTVRGGSAGRGSAGDRVAVLFVDLDGFKPVNDSFGHEKGDAVLREIAQRLQHSVRESDTLARLGGDEFVVMIEARDAEVAAQALAQRIIGGLRRLMSMNGQDVEMSCSIGIAVFPDHDDTGQRLLACADAAMYTAKRAGGGTWVVYDRSMAGDATEQLLMHQALRHAIERSELALHYQPKVSAKNGQVHGFEALLRWQHPQRGPVSPGIFIPLAERFGLIGTIGNWVVEEACRQLAQWQDEGVDCRIAVNLSPYQLRHPGLPMHIRDCLERHGVHPSRLVCEITETALMETLGAESDVLDQISKLGVRLSIDDFGTGYSSLAHLRSIPARQLKIDRSFVVDLAVDSDARAVLDAIVRLAHALRMEVVAEGVETHEQQVVLTQLGCDVLQGYFIARPMPAAAVTPWLQASKVRALVD
ncbi:bifunctional diguanylate cyclase/phosphodiesterase [Variovorax sp. KK3]|uniref:putative bifunctional diguanylate cyclase/phosphodiesterase n=1 Tax=Variovorax sp. KK3 TaxID=1855728 RepID=UPI00097C52DC|nr:bifunctional diguanylate cyclase/phosphodiesterase [Variovorax sp. KK3]